VDFCSRDRLDCVECITETSFSKIVSPRFASRGHVSKLFVGRSNFEEFKLLASKLPAIAAGSLRSSLVGSMGLSV
jgi:hypothetical protein